MNGISRRIPSLCNRYYVQQSRFMSTPPDRYTHTQDQIEVSNYHFLFKLYIYIFMKGLLFYFLYCISLFHIILI